MRLPAGQPAGAGGHHRRAPDRGGAQRLLPAPHDRPGEALLPVSGRIERLLPGGAEGLLLPDPGAADRGVPAAGGVHRRGGGEPLPGQRHHKAHVLRPAEPDVPCGAAGGQPPLAGVGRRPWDPPLGLRLHLRPAGPALEPALQDGGALLHAPQLAHAQRRPEQLRRGRLRAGRLPSWPTAASPPPTPPSLPPMCARCAASIPSSGS